MIVIQIHVYHKDCSVVQLQILIINLLIVDPMDVLIITNSNISSHFNNFHLI